MNQQDLYEMPAVPGNATLWGISLLFVVAFLLFLRYGLDKWYKEPESWEDEKHH